MKIRLHPVMPYASVYERWRRLQVQPAGYMAYSCLAVFEVWTRRVPLYWDQILKNARNWKPNWLGDLADD